MKLPKVHETAADVLDRFCHSKPCKECPLKSPLVVSGIHCIPPTEDEIHIPIRYEELMNAGDQTKE